MRTKERWEQVIRPKVLSIFSPRIQKDLKSIPLPKDIKVQSYYIWGEVDTGKTIYACQVLLQESLNNYLDKKIKTFEFIPTPDLLEALRKSFKEDNTSEIIERYKTADFLILDEFGMDKSTEWVLQTLYLIINYRYENLLTTIVTSNLNPKEAVKEMGDSRIIKRMLRMGKVINKKKY